MRRGELAVDAIERVGDGVGDAIFRQIFLELENVAAEDRYIQVLGLINPPHQHMKFTRILREIGCNLFADKSVRLICDRETAIDAVVIGDSDEIHPALP